MEEAQRGKQHPEFLTIQRDDGGRKSQVHDSSLDYKGRLPLRHSTGSWKASFFIIAVEFSERLSYYGISTNLITYMTKVMHQDLATAATNVNIWAGVTTITPLLGGFVADAYIGCFPMILFSAILYALGLGLLTMTQYIPSLKPCSTAFMSSCQHVSKVHKLVFFVATYVMSLATGGYKPCLESFGADQFDDSHSEERMQKLSFFNWWNISLCSALFLGVTIIVYIEDFVGWDVACLILTIIMGLTILVFVFGRPIYRYRTPQGSPLTPLLRVFVAALAKRNLPYPSDPALFYELPESQKIDKPLLLTDKLRFLNKAAIIEEHETGDNRKKQSSWRLATMTEVEELKLILRMIPIWGTSLVFGIGIAQTSTFFIKQASTMNRKVYKHFEIPPASAYAIAAIGMMFTIAIYDKILIPYLRQVTGNERGINILKRIGIGMIFLILAMVTSALVERRRQKASLDGKIMNVFWLAPQFLIIGMGDGFSIVGMQEYFYGQVPDSMRSLGLGLYLSVIGVGNFLSSFLIAIVNFVTSHNGGKRWIGKDLTNSQLDYFYWFIVAINVLNLCVFVVLAKNYSYKNVQAFVSDSYDYEVEKREELTA